MRPGFPLDSIRHEKGLSKRAKRHLKIVKRQNCHIHGIYRALERSIKVLLPLPTAMRRHKMRRESRSSLEQGSEISNKTINDQTLDLPLMACG
jgi:hypothetical protein